MATTLSCPSYREALCGGAGLARAGGGTKRRHNSAEHTGIARGSWAARVLDGHRSATDDEKPRRPSKRHFPSPKSWSAWPPLSATPPSTAVARAPTTPAYSTLLSLCTPTHDRVYVRGKKIGAGAFSSVYRISDGSTVDYAAKRLQITPNDRGDATGCRFVERALQEVRFMQALSSHRCVLELREVLPPRHTHSAPPTPCTLPQCTADPTHRVRHRCCSTRRRTASPSCTS